MPIKKIEMSMLAVAEKLALIGSDKNKEDAYDIIKRSRISTLKVLYEHKDYYNLSAIWKILNHYDPEKYKLVTEPK